MLVSKYGCILVPAPLAIIITRECDAIVMYVNGRIPILANPGYCYPRNPGY